MGQLSVAIPERFRPALATLLLAYDYASDSGVESWQFAIALPELLSTGAKLPDLSWLIHKKFAERAKETTIPGDATRSFRRLAPTCFPTDTCIVLTFTGAAELRSALASTTLNATAAQDPPPANPTMGETHSRDTARTRPEWDATRRELRFGGQVIKRYRVPARNQALILTAFQEDGWPECIDDPIPPEDDQDPKRRLNVTIKSLNRNQVTPLIRFHGNGNGLQVYWEAVECD